MRFVPGIVYQAKTTWRKERQVARGGWTQKAGWLISVLMGDAIELTRLVVVVMSPSCLHGKVELY